MRAGVAVIVLVAQTSFACRQPDATVAPAPSASPAPLPVATDASGSLDASDPGVALQAPYTLARTGTCAAVVSDGTDLYWVDAHGVKALAETAPRGTPARTLPTPPVDALAAGPGVVFAVRSESVNVPRVPGATSSEPSIPLDMPVRSTITQLVPAGRRDPVYTTMVGYDVTDCVVTNGALAWRETGYSDILGFVLGEERRLPLAAILHPDAGTSGAAKARTTTVTPMVGARTDGGARDASPDPCDGCVTSDVRYRYWLDPSDHTVRRRRNTEAGRGVVLAEHLNDATHLLQTDHALYWLEATKGRAASWSIRTIPKP